MTLFPSVSLDIFARSQIFRALDSISCWRHLLTASFHKITAKKSSKLLHLDSREDSYQFDRVTEGGCQTRLNIPLIPADVFFSVSCRIALRGQTKYDTKNHCFSCRRNRRVGEGEGPREATHGVGSESPQSGYRCQGLENEVRGADVVLVTRH